MVLQKEVEQLSPGLHRVSIAAGIALLGLGAGGVLFPLASSKMYGVPLAKAESEDAGVAYVRATAVRDLSLGGMFLAFAMLRNRQALGVTTLLSSVVAVGDGSIALRHGPAPGKVLPIHWGSAVALWGLAYLLLRENPRESHLEETPSMEN